MNTIRFTLPAGAFEDLIVGLKAGGIAVDPPQGLGTVVDASAERMATLQLTFLHDEPDLRREVPPIPG